jgi:release factor glutamine methyltransferase
VTLLEIINRTADFFQKKGLESPRLQIELLLSHVLNLPRMQLYLQFERVLTESETETLRSLVKRRAEREPLQYILGQVQFCGHKLECAPGVLIPRPETELFVEIIKQDLKNQPPATLADIGTGTGAIAISLAHALPDWKVLGIEYQPDAAHFFQKNLTHSGLTNLHYLASDLLEAVEEPVHVVVANLPYLTTEEMQNLQPELHHEPTTALHGGTDGLDYIRLLIQQLRPEVRHVFLELGLAQSTEVTSLLLAHGYANTRTEKDLLGRDRFVLASRAA